MTTERITITLPPDVAADARHAVAAGQADSVSAYVTEALQARARRDRDRAALLDLMGGPPPADAIAEARRLMGLPPAPAA